VWGLWCDYLGCNWGYGACGFDLLFDVREVILGDFGVIEVVLFLVLVGFSCVF
jgi:hypothetical protein